MDIPIDATVQCTDGDCGKSTFLLANPITGAVTHFVVKDRNLPGSPVRLVPVERIAEVSRNLIRLNCTRAEVAEMQPFATTHYVEEEVPDPIHPGDQNGRGS